MNRAQIEIQEMPFKHKKRVFYCESHWTLKQVAQRACGISTLGDVQKNSRYDPWQLLQQPLLWVRIWTGLSLEVPSNLSCSVTLWEEFLLALCFPLEQNTLLAKQRTMILELWKAWMWWKAHIPKSPDQGANQHYEKLQGRVAKESNSEENTWKGQLNLSILYLWHSLSLNCTDIYISIK